VRNQAYDLLQKVLRHDPRKSQEAVPAIVGCLRSENLQVATTALGKVPEIVALIEDDLQVRLTIPKVLFFSISLIDFASLYSLFCLNVSTWASHAALMLQPR